MQYIDFRTDEHAFTHMMREESKYLHGIVYQILRTYQDAVADVMQETFLHAWEHRARFRGDSSERTWLTRIAVNQALGQLRLKSTRIEYASTHDIDQLIGNSNVETIVLASERSRLLTEAIGQLPPHHAQSIIARYYDDLTLEQEAKLYGYTIGAAKARRNDGLNGLRSNPLIPSL